MFANMSAPNQDAIWNPQQKCAILKKKLSDRMEATAKAMRAKKDRINALQEELRETMKERERVRHQLEQIRKERARLRIVARKTKIIT